MKLVMNAIPKRRTNKSLAQEDANRKEHPCHKLISDCQKNVCNYIFCYQYKGRETVQNGKRVMKETKIN